MNTYYKHLDYKGETQNLNSQMKHRLLPTNSQKQNYKRSLWRRNSKKPDNEYREKFPANMNTIEILYRIIINHHRHSTKMMVKNNAMAFMFYV